MVYMITYDLNKSGKDYDNVIQAIKDASNGICCSYWKSSYLIQSDYTSANDIFDLIKPYLDSDDRLIVLEVNNNKQGWLTKNQWDYINNSIFG